MFDSMLDIKVSSQLAGQMTIETELHNTSIEVFIPSSFPLLWRKTFLVSLMAYITFFLFFCFFLGGGGGGGGGGTQCVKCMLCLNQCSLTISPERELSYCNMCYYAASISNMQCSFCLGNRKMFDPDVITLFVFQ